MRQHMRCYTNFSDLSPNKKQLHPMDQISGTTRKTPTYNKSPIHSYSNADLEIQRLINVIQMKDDEIELFKRKLENIENSKNEALKVKNNDLNDREEYIRELQFKIREIEVENSNMSDYYKKQLKNQISEMDTLRSQIKELQTEQQQKIFSRINDEIDQLKQCLEMKTLQNQQLYEQGQELMEEINILKQEQNELIDQIEYWKKINKQIQEQCETQLNTNNQDRQQQFNREVNKLKEENQKLQDIVDSTNQKIKQLNEDISIQNHLKNTKMEEYKEELAIAQEEIMKYKIYFQEKYETYDQQNRIICQMNQMFEKLQNQNVILSERLHDCQEQVFREKSSKEDQTVNFHEILANKNEEIENLHIDLQSLHIQINELNIVQQKLLSELENVRTKLLDRERQVFLEEQVKDEINRNQDDLAKQNLQSQLQKYETENFNLRVLLESKSRECEDWKANYLKKANKFS